MKAFVARPSPCIWMARSNDRWRAVSRNASSAAGSSVLSTRPGHQSQPSQSSISDGVAVGEPAARASTDQGDAGIRSCRPQALQRRYGTQQVAEPREHAYDGDPREVTVDAREHGARLPSRPAPLHAESLKRARCLLAQPGSDGQLGRNCSQGFRDLAFRFDSPICQVLRISAVPTFSDRSRPYALRLCHRMVTASRRSSGPDRLAAPRTSVLRPKSEGPRSARHSTVRSTLITMSGLCTSTGTMRSSASPRSSAA